MSEGRDFNTAASGSKEPIATVALNVCCYEKLH